jgi:hypothetical protein
LREGVHSVDIYDPTINPLYRDVLRALRQLRLGGIASVLETRLRQAQAETMAPIDLISCLVMKAHVATGGLEVASRKSRGFCKSTECGFPLAMRGTPGCRLK